jgi:hypothetical protein
LKQDLSFEVICQPMNKNDNMKKQVELIINKEGILMSLKTSFTNKDNIIQLLVEYHNTTCQVVNKYPEGYPYLEVFDIKYILDIFKDTTIQQELGILKYKIINAFNKIMYVMTDKRFILPVKEIEEGRIFSLEKIDISEFTTQPTRLLDEKEYILYLNRFNRIIKKDKIKVEIRDIIDSNISHVAGMMTNFGVIIPCYIKDKLGNNKIYYPLIDEILKKEVPKKKELDTVQEILEIRRQISNKIQTSQSKNKIIKYVTRIIKNLELSRTEKIDELVKVFEKIQPSLMLKDIRVDTKFAFKHLANEMINDNINNTLLSGLQLETTDIENNSILYNINDIEKWSRNYERIQEE